MRVIMFIVRIYLATVWLLVALVAAIIAILASPFTFAEWLTERRKQQKAPPSTTERRGARGP